jgi:hypothetical protein
VAGSYAWDASGNLKKPPFTVYTYKDEKMVAVE